VPVQPTAVDTTCSTALGGCRNEAPETLLDVLVEPERREVGLGGDPLYHVGEHGVDTVVTEQVRLDTVLDEHRPVGAVETGVPGLADAEEAVLPERRVRADQPRRGESLAVCLGKQVRDQPHRWLGGRQVVLESRDHLLVVRVRHRQQRQQEHVAVVRREVERLDEVGESEPCACGGALGDLSLDPVGPRRHVGGDILGNAEREVVRGWRRPDPGVHRPRRPLLALHSGLVAVEDSGDPVELGQQMAGRALVRHDVLGRYGNPIRTGRLCSFRQYVLRSDTESVRPHTTVRMVTFM
jgi:hypothetical protein